MTGKRVPSHEVFPSHDISPKDEPELVCDNSKFKNKTDWQPEINIDQTLKDTLDYWRNIV